MQSGCSPARNQKYLEAHPVLFGLFPIYNWPLQLWFGFAVGFVMLCKSLLQEIRFFKSKPAMLKKNLADPCRHNNGLEKLSSLCCQQVFIQQLMWVMYPNPPHMIWIFIERLVIGWPRAECIIQALEQCHDTMWHHIGICFATQNGHHVQTFAPIYFQRLLDAMRHCLPHATLSALDSMRHALALAYIHTNKWAQRSGHAFGCGKQVCSNNVFEARLRLRLCALLPRLHYLDA